MTTRSMSWSRQSTTDAPQATRLPGLACAFLFLMLGGLPAHAAAPVMTLPATVTIPEDEATNLVYSVTDADSPLYAVTITARSSDTTLIPNASLVPSGAGGTRFLAITPALHKSGSATITMIATDDSLESSTNTFTLNVTFTNYPPTFTLSAANRTIREDAGSTNISFAIADVETAVTNLTVTATSSNTTLVPNGNLVLSGTSASRTLNVTAVTNLFGTSLISIVVTDGGSASVTNDFLLTVLSVNDAPTFSISTNRIDQSEDAGLTTVSNFLTGISSGPANESGQSNWLVLNYTASFFVQAPAVDGNGTLTFQVKTNSNGTNTIGFVLVDDGGTANGGKDRSTNTLTLAVASVNDLPIISTTISDLTINEDAGRTNLSYSVYDADHALSSLTITATSTNTSLVPTNGFVFTGTSTNRTLGITALTNAFGTTEISLVVTDPAGGKATNTFLLTVNSVLDAPIMTGTTNRTLLEDLTTNLTGIMTLYDGDTAITNVSVTASSSNTNVVGVAISATNNVSSNSFTLTLDYTLPTNANGSATITLIADDGAVTTTNSFLFTVTSVNDAPSFTLSTNFVLVAEDAGTITNASFLTGISAGPSNESSQTWTFTVTSGTNFGYATAPAISTNGTLTFRTATNAVGTNTITVVMKDNGGTTSGGKDSVTNTFSLGVTAVNDAPYFTGISAKTILEDATTNNTAVVNVIDTDTVNTSVAVTVASSDTNLVDVAITVTNAIGTTNSALTLTFTPVADANGSATITLIADDGALTKTNSFVLTVSPVNDQPSFSVSTNLVLVAEDAGIVTNASFLTGISTGPTNEGSQTWTFTVTSGTNFSYAQAPAISTNGTLTFRTATNAFGTNTITVVMKDNGGTTSGGKDSVTNTFTIGVTAVNDAPKFAALASKTILEDATTNNTAVINVIDTDTASSNLVVTVSSSDTNLATVAITATNIVNATNAALTLTFTPQADANGSLSITLIADDGALTTTNSFLLTVTAVNDQPSFTVSTNLVLVAEDAGIVTNASFLTGISTGPTNEVNQTWAFTVTSGTNFGYAQAPAISTNGTLTFRVATNAVGTNTITVVMKDNGGTANGGKDSVTNTFSLAVTSANDAPTFAGIASKTILEDATTNNTAVVNVIDTDTAISSVVVTVSSSDTNLATVAITSTNVLNSTNAALTLTFTPQADANGSASITLIADDGALTKTNSFLLTVTAVNDQPSFTLSTNLVIVAEDAGIVTNASFLTGISTGPTNEVNQTWAFTVTSGTNFGYAQAPAIGTNGTLTFRVATNASGTNTITVVMKDNGGTSSGGKDSVTNTFSLGVTPVNDAPRFTGVTGKTILEDAVTNNTATVNVIDVDTAISSVSVTVSSSDTNVADVAITATNTVSSTNAALTLTFTPATNANGSATITLIADDGTATTTNSFLLTVSAVNDQPSFTFSTNLVLVAEDAGTVTNASFLTGISTGPANESSQTWTFTVTSGTNFSYATAPAIATNGTLTFKAALNATGTNTITVVMKDNGGTANGGKDSVTNTFSLGVTPVNDAPGFTGITSRTIREDATTNNTAVINVFDTDTAITNVSVTASSSDTNIADVAITSTNLVSNSNAALTLTFTPATNANGSVSITLIADDGALTTTNSFLLTVTAVNDAPSFTLSTNLVLVAEDAGIVTNASFLAGISTGPANEASQTWTFKVKSGTNFGYAVAPAISTNGTLTFKTATNAIGTNLITVVMKDNGSVANGGVDSVTNTFSLAVTAVNDAPTFAGIASKTIREDATSTNTAVVNVLDSDTDISSVSVTVSSSDTNFADVAITATNVVSSSNAALTLTFTPKTNANGSLSITLIADDGAATTTNSFLLTVSAVNDAPDFLLSTNLVLVAEDAGTITNANFLTGLSAGPTNEANQTWLFLVTSSTNFGYAVAPTISTNGTLIFKVATNASGTNTLTIVMKDNGGVANGGQNASTNTFMLGVTPVNDAPRFTGLATKTILEDATTNLTSTITVIDVDTTITSVTVTASSSDTNLATVAITATNFVNSTNAQLTLTYTPQTNANGNATITVIADDGALTTTNSFLLTVTAVNDVPSFNLAISSVTVDKYNVPVSQASAVTNLAPGAFNETNQTVSFVVSNSNSSLFTTQPAISTNGTLTFTPGAKAGTGTVTVRAKDNAGTSNGGVDTSAAQTFTIVIPSNPFVGLGGAYAGLFFETNAMANDSSGYFRLVLATNGTFTGHLLCAGSSNQFGGQFSAADPTLSLDVSNTTHVLNLALDISTNWTETISGSVSNTAASWSVQLLSYLNVNAGGFPAALAGEYLVSIPGNADAADGPPGFSTLSIIVSNNGGVSVSGYLADDTFVTQHTHSSRNGSVPFYVGLDSTGSASGWLTFVSGGANQLQTDSEVVWIGGSGGVFYPSGFTNATVASGSIYDSTATDLLPMSSGEVVLSDGGLSTPITNSYTLASNVITIDPAATNGLSLTITRATGQITGEFTAGGQTNAINSVILQSTNAARGYFVSTNAVGSFIFY